MRMFYLFLLFSFSILLSTVYSANGQSHTDAFALNKGSLKSTAEFICGDSLPYAIVLSKRGDYRVGVQTINLIHKNQKDILNYKDSTMPLYDSHLKVEVW